MTPIVCFWAKIIKGEPSGGGVAEVKCSARAYAHEENICSGFTGEGEGEKRSNINRNENYTLSRCQQRDRQSHKYT